MKAFISVSSARAAQPTERSNSRAQSKEVDKEQPRAKRSRSKSGNTNQECDDLCLTQNDPSSLAMGKRGSHRGIVSSRQSGRRDAVETAAPNVTSLVHKFAAKVAEAEEEAREQAETMERKNSTRKRREREAAAAMAKVVALTAEAEKDTALKPSNEKPGNTTQQTAVPSSECVPIVERVESVVVDLVEEEIEIADVKSIEGIVQYIQAEESSTVKHENCNNSHATQIAQEHPEVIDRNDVGTVHMTPHNSGTTHIETISLFDEPVPESESKLDEDEESEYDQVDAFDIYSAVRTAVWNQEVVSILFFQDFDPAAFTQADLDRAKLEQREINTKTSKRNEWIRPKSVSAEQSNSFATKPRKLAPFRDSSSMLVAHKSVESKASDNEDEVVVVIDLEHPTDFLLPVHRSKHGRIVDPRKPKPDPFALSKSQQQMVEMEEAQRPARCDSFLRFQLEPPKGKGSTKSPPMFAISSERDKTGKPKQEKTAKTVALTMPIQARTDSKEELTFEDVTGKRQRSVSEILSSALPLKIETITRERSASRGRAKSRERSYSRKSGDEFESKLGSSIRAFSRRLTMKASEINDVDQAGTVKSQDTTLRKDAAPFGRVSQRYNPVPSPDGVEFCSVGLRTSVDIFAFLDNGIRRDILDLYALLNTFAKRLADLTLREVAILFEWWAGMRMCILETVDIRESMIYERLESRGAMLEFELSSAKRRARRDGLYRAVAAVDSMELKFVQEESDNLFMELVQNCEQLRKLLVQDMKIAETEGAAELERYLDGVALVELETEIYKHMYKLSSSEWLLPTCVSWITNQQLFVSWENKHLQGLQRIRFKRMYRKYQAKHLALGTVLVEERAGATSSVWFKA